MEIIDSLLFVPLITGPIFMLAGLVMRAYPPKSINGLYGYRTPSSMQNQERWDFAQKYAAIEMIKMGGLLLLTSILGLLPNVSNDFSLYLGLGLMLVFIIILFVRVERAINQNFANTK